MEEAKNPLVEKYGAQKQWVNWRIETRDGKPTKVPVQPDGSYAKSNDSNTWSTYDELNVEMGAGIVFTPECTLLGIDLDHFIHKGEVVEPYRELLTSFIDTADTYTELSPSETGLHLYFALDEPVPSLRRSRKTWKEGEQTYGYEIYTKGRFFTTTHVPYGPPRPVRTVTREELRSVLSLIGYPWDDGRGTTEGDGSATTPSALEPSRTPLTSGGSSTIVLTDDLLLEKLFASQAGERLKRLYDGDVSDYGGDESAGDMALVSALAFWTAKNAEQMERIWLASPLGKRKKTTSRRDYRVRTITTALASTTDVYTPPRAKDPTTNNDERTIHDLRAEFLEARIAVSTAQTSKEQKAADAWLKAVTTDFALRFHEWFALQHPHLLYEKGEDKVFWEYNEDTGVYEEFSLPVIRGRVMKLLIAEGLPAHAKETFVRDCLSRYRGEHEERAILYEDFDNDDDWFHAENGWVQLKTLTFEPHTPLRYSRRKSSVKYDHRAICPLYDKFLDEDIQLKRDEIRVLDQYSGLILTHDMRHQQMLTLIGRPGSGKSTLIELWFHVLGDMAVQKRLTDVTGDRARFIGADLVGRTLCWFDEIEVRRAEFDNALGTQITGEFIHVERKGINGTRKAPNYLKNVLTANSLPYASTSGIYRRLLYFELQRSFTSEGTMDRDMPNKLRGEASGVLNRMLRGLSDLRKMGGFTVIEGHSERIEEYKASSDPIAEFLLTYFEPVVNWSDDENTPISTRDMLTAYKHTMGEMKWIQLTPRRFGRMLSAQPLEAYMTLKQVRKTNWRGWIGVRLKEEYRWERTVPENAIIVEKFEEMAF